MRAAVLCLGDVGRSPRMQYHAVSLADSSPPVSEVHLVGYAGSECFPEVTSNPRIRLHLLHPPSSLRSERLPFVVRSLLRVLWQTAAVLWTLLFSMPPPDVVLVQNPPSVPTLPLALLVCRLRGARLVVDWHNFGHSLLALNRPRGAADWLVRLYFACERWFGRRADAHLCVTQAMQQELATDVWRIPSATVLHDQPPRHFRPTPLDERHTLFTTLRAELENALHPLWPQDARATDADDEQLGTRTLFTERPVAVKRKAPVRLRPGRPALLVSSTSWTPDEDFSLLLAALEAYDARATQQLREEQQQQLETAPAAESRRGIDDAPAQGNSSSSSSGLGLPARLVLLVTGKGPDRARFEHEMRALNRRLRFVRAATLWLQPEDYPRLLGSADLGISLHTSSSGIDLPMKVVDMFGCEVPVCAASFRCLPELVRHGENGLVFGTSDELATQLLELFVGWPDGPGARRLEALRQRLHVQQAQPVARWEPNWRLVARPVLVPDE